MMKVEEENIFKLCKKGDINILRKFLKEIDKERLIDVVNDIDMDMEEMTPLMYASAGGFTEAVEELVLCGAEVGFVISNKDGNQLVKFKDMRGKNFNQPKIHKTGHQVL